jgi:hypothetical protein
MVPGCDDRVSRLAEAVERRVDRFDSEEVLRPVLALKRQLNWFRQWSAYWGKADPEQTALLGARLRVMSAIQ